MAAVKEINWDKAPLGERPDSVVAKMYGVLQETVRRARLQRGIKATYIDRVDWGKQPLGKKPDAEIAKEIGCNRESVRSARVRRGIPSVIDKVAGAALLCEIVLESLPYQYPLPFREVYSLVVNDYGTVTERTVYRAIRRLRDAGKIQSTRSQVDSKEWGYLRVRGR